MSAEYNYDADAQFFPFFVVTMTAIVTLPLTYSLLRAPSELAASRKGPQITSSYQPENADIIDAQRAKQKRKELRLKRMLFVLGGWLVMAYMIYLMVVTERATPKIWNPYEILGIPESSTEKEIKSRYKRLSLIMHPDKRKIDQAKNETLDMINDAWVDIVKANEALTDEDVRENFIRYGHPDGRQSTSFGIALPKLLVAEGSGKYVLIFYGALLGIGLPWLVGKWWYGMQKVTKEKVLVTSAGNMFREYGERMQGAEIVSALSSAVEYQDILSGSKAETGLGKLEMKLQSLDATEISPKAFLKLKELDDPVRRKALALIWAYLTRTSLGDATLEAEKYELAPTALHMNDAFVSVCLAYGFTLPLLSCYRLTQSLIQAVPPVPLSQPLLQLPHFTSEKITAMEKSQADLPRRMNVQAFMSLPAEQRHALAKAAGIDKSQLSVAEDVARQLPLLRIAKTFFKVQGEKHIIPGSLVQFVIKARFIPPGTPDVPSVNEKDLLDIDPAEGDIQAQKQEPEQHAVTLAHSPYMPMDKAPKWHVFLADHRQGKIAVPPFTFMKFDKKPFDDAGKPTFNMITMKMQFQAPPQVGEYKFRMHLVCDSYLGFDQWREVTLNIEDASKVNEVDEDDISEPDEDSIAGQMAALKGQPTADPNKPKRQRKAIAKQADEESDYESGTDEDVESESETDTDTDTDDE